MGGRARRKQNSNGREPAVNRGDRVLGPPHLDTGRPGGPAPVRGSPLPPPGARDVSVWRRAIDFVSTAPPAYTPHFIHRDYQHFNLLWTRERLSGVVDWCFASNGPADADVAHCRLNLTVLFSASWAERFRLAYEAEAGRSLDPWWDIAGLMSYSQEWKKFIPLQVGDRMHVDIGGMDTRMEDILEFALQRTA